MLQNLQSHLNFFDPRWTSDHKPYAHERFKQICMERYIISKQIHTDYNSVGLMTPTEREYVLKFINDELEAREQALQELEANNAKG